MQDRQTQTDLRSSGAPTSLQPTSQTHNTPCSRHPSLSPSQHLFAFSAFTSCPGNQTKMSLVIHRLVGLVVKASASRAEDPGFESTLAAGFFRGRVMPVTQKLALQWLPCQAPGVIGSAVGLIGQVSVYCDWVRWKV